MKSYNFIIKKTADEVFIVRFFMSFSKYHTGNWWNANRVPGVLTHGVRKKPP
ncbi:MAG: hypothetical protein ACI9XB_000849, partial [Gammaproteobacteria bacterium]